MSSSTEIRGDWKVRLIGKIVGWVIRIYSYSYDAKVEDRSGISSMAGETHDKPIVLLMWHNRLFGGPPFLQRYCGNRSMVALASASKDGSIISAAVSVLGIGAARGSSSRRGAAALVTLRKAIKSGKDACVTPDGPRGPMCKLQPGAVKLAQASGAAILMMQVQMEDYWELNSWDKLRIPKPFSKVKIILDELIDVPKDLSNEDFDALCEKIEGTMNHYN